MLKELNNENFAAETKDGVKLVEFYATWCGYCKKQQQELDKMDKIWIGQVDADMSPELASNYGINSLPTFLIMKNGKEIDKIVGLTTKEKLVNRILPHLL